MIFLLRGYDLLGGVQLELLHPAAAGEGPEVKPLCWEGIAADFRLETSCYVVTVQVLGSFLTGDKPTIPTGDRCTPICREQYTRSGAPY